MERVWFIYFDGHECGPYSVLELKSDPRFTPDLLVRRSNWPKDKWIAARYVQELEDLFKDDEDETEPDPLKAKNGDAKLAGRDTIALDMRNDPSNYIWIIILVIAILYVLFKLHHSL